MASSPTKQRPNFEVELQAIEDYRRFAALTIQRYYRGWIVRLHRARKVCHGHRPHRWTATDSLGTEPDRARPAMHAI